MIKNRKLQRILNNIDYWDAADAVTQEDIATRVAESLGEEYVLSNIQTYTCGETSHRIGAFTHRDSAIALHLIPGAQTRLRGEPVSVAPFLIGAHPVTQAQWYRYGGAKRFHQTWYGDNLPIMGLSWNDGQAWLKRTGSALRYPSLAEWVYACWATATTCYYWGERFEADHVWCRENTIHEEKPGVYDHEGRHNAFGLLDMVGLVSEWCADACTDKFCDVNCHAACGSSMRHEADLHAGEFRSDRFIHCHPSKLRMSREMGMRVALSL